MSNLRRDLPISMLWLGLSCACAGVLGIEDAACDAEFSPACAGEVDDRGNGGGGSSSVPAAGAAGLAAGAGAAGSAALPVVDGPPPESLCEEYCRVLGENCVEDDRQYASPEGCRAVCELLEPGERGALQGNTVHCRLSRARLATRTGEPSDYCFSAGPGGAGVCGEDCEGFCTVMSAKCEQMGPLAECLSACGNVPDLSAPPNNVTYDIRQQSGDSVQCRLFHVSAASLDPAGHCLHAAGAAPCSAPPTQ